MLRALCTQGFTIFLRLRLHFPARLFHAFMQRCLPGLTFLLKGAAQRFQLRLSLALRLFHQSFSLPHRFLPPAPVFLLRRLHAFNFLYQHIIPPELSFG